MTSILKVDELQDSSGNLIIKEVANAITIGASGDTITIPAGATVSNLGTASGFGGITVADQWRITADVTSSGDLTSNWERCDTSPQGSLSAVTESSGIFSFPSTGYWLITFTASGMTSGSDNIAISIYGTPNNSSYAQLAYGANGGSSQSQDAMCQTIIDVTDTAQVKVKMNAASISAGSVWYGDTDITYTGTTFIRLGDT